MVFFFLGGGRGGGWGLGGKEKERQPNNLVYTFLACLISGVTNQEGRDLMFY